MGPRPSSPYLKSKVKTPNYSNNEKNKLLNLEIPIFFLGLNLNFHKDLNPCSPWSTLSSKLVVMGIES
jgi:hypothetical protein